MKHECIQQENIGLLKEACKNLEKAITRLDSRINGTFDKIGEHIKESPGYRSAIEVLKVEVKTIKQEKLNTTKASQWRIGLIIGAICVLPNIILVIIKILQDLK